MTTYAGEVVWKRESTPALLVETQAGSSPLDISVVISQKSRKQPSSRPSHTTVGYMSTGYSIVPQGHVLNFVHSTFVIART